MTMAAARASRPDVGSSIKMTEGLATSSTAMVSRFLCSTDSPDRPGSPTRAFLKGVSSTSSSTCANHKSVVQAATPQEPSSMGSAQQALPPARTGLLLGRSPAIAFLKGSAQRALPPARTGLLLGRSPAIAFLKGSAQQALPPAHIMNSFRMQPHQCLP